MSICRFCGIHTFHGDEFCSPECYDDHQLALEDTQEIFMDELPFCARCQDNGCTCDDNPYPIEPTDVEADADTLRSCGWGTDEDYYIEPYDCDLWNEV
jgi:hypothetical protein